MTGLDLLWPFQLEAVEKARPNLILLCCDDMGAGKTYIGAGTDVVRREQSALPAARTLIFAPLSTHQGDTSSWKETYELVTGLRAFVIDPKARAQSWRRFDNYPGPCAWIMHYEAARLMPELVRVRWLHVILDECHRIQNRKAQQTQAIKKIPTTYKTGLSGTPTTGNPDKFWSVLNWLDRKAWSSYWNFRKSFVADAPVYGKDGELLPYRQIIGPQNVEELQRRIAPFYIRRTKKQVLPNLPDKLPAIRRIVELGPEQRRVYKEMKRDMIAWVHRQQQESGSDDMDPIMAQNAAVRTMRMQQFSGAYATVTQELKTIKTGERVLKDVVKLSEPSAKLDEVMSILKDNEDQQFAVWSNFKQMIDLLEARLVKAGIDYSKITGDVPAAERGAEIGWFQRGENRVFIGTVQAGGVGITLTATNMPIFLDRNWSPAINVQCEDRHHRPGQTREVQPVDIIAKDTVDLSRIEGIEMKWSWVLKLLGDIP